MFCLAQKDTRPRACPGRGVLVVVLTLSLVAPSFAEEVAPGPVDSLAWQVRFEAWVEATLIQEQLQDAAQNLPKVDPDATLRVLNEVVGESVAQLRGSRYLPSDVIPRLLTSAIKGKTVRVAKRFKPGQEEELLEALETSDLGDDPDAVYLRAQLRDLLAREAHPVERLEQIADYRAALRLPDPNVHLHPRRLQKLAAHARLRIGQIYIGLGFFPEARSTFQALLAMAPEEPFQSHALISQAEAAYQDRDPNTALKAIQRLNPKKLPPESQQWALQRLGDCLFRLERYSKAAIAYTKLLETTDRPISPLELIAIRLAFSHLQTGVPILAQQQLKPIFFTDSPTEISAAK